MSVRRLSITLLALVAGCSNARCASSPSRGDHGPAPESRKALGVSGDFAAQVWADNWFAMYLDDALVAEDSVAITTERSFNSETFGFEGSYPLNLNFVIKDFKQNDTGLEYIGRRNQQMGDGGFIAQIFDNKTGAVVAVTNSSWRCLVIHEAPLDKSCEKAADPASACKFSKRQEPEGWKSPNFDTSGWSQATEYSEDAVRPKHGYNQIDWSANAKLIWTSDLETHNTLLCKLTVEKP